MMELDVGDATQVYIAFLVYLDLIESKLFVLLLSCYRDCGGKREVGLGYNIYTVAVNSQFYNFFIHYIWN